LRHLNFLSNQLEEKEKIPRARGINVIKLFVNKLLLKAAILILASFTKKYLESAILATVPIFTLATLG
jgi:hypothetical protein